MLNHYSREVNQTSSTESHLEISNSILYGLMADAGRVAILACCFDFPRGKR